MLGGCLQLHALCKCAPRIQGARAASTALLLKACHVCWMLLLLQAFEKAPGVVKMVMPRWSQEEIKLGLQHVYPATKYPGMTAARVQNLFMYYNGVPRLVLGKPSEISGPAADRLDLRDFNNAVSTCDASQVCAGQVACLYR